MSLFVSTSWCYLMEVSKLWSSSLCGVIKLLRFLRIIRNDVMLVFSTENKNISIRHTTLYLQHSYTISILQKFSEPKVHKMWNKLMIPAKHFEPKLITLNVTSNTILEEIEAFKCKGYARRNVMVRLGWRFKCQHHILACGNSCQKAALRTSQGSKKNSCYNDGLFTSESHLISHSELE
jgi:hypothetical protein